MALILFQMWYIHTFYYLELRVDNSCMNVREKTRCNFILLPISAVQKHASFALKSYYYVINYNHIVTFYFNVKVWYMIYGV